MGIVPLLSILLGFGLRVFRLGEQSLWYDEGLSIFQASHDPAAIVSLAANGAHPPLYNWLLHFWMALAGAGEFSTRYLSLFYGVLALALLFAVGKVLLGKRGAVLALVVGTLSPFLLYYAQETRTYSLTLALSLLSTWFYLQGLRRPDRLTWKLGYVAAATAAIYSHYYAWLIVGFQNAFFVLWAWALAKGKTSPWAALAHWATTQIALLILYLPWSGILLDKYQNYITPTRGVPLPTIFYQTLVSFSLGYSGGQAGATPGQADLFPDHWIVLALSGGLLLLAALGVLGRPARPGSAWQPTGAQGFLLHRVFLPLYVLLPIIEIFLLSVGKRDFAPRYLFFAAPAYYLLIGQGLALWRGHLRVLAAPALLLVLGTSSLSLGNYYFDSTYWRDDLRGTAQFVNQRLREGDAIVMNAWYLTPIFDYYYRGHAPMIGLPNTHPPNEAETVRALQGLASQYTGIWLVLWQDYYSDPQGLVRGWLEQNALRVETRKFRGGIEVHYFLTSPPLLAAMPSGARLAGKRLGDRMELVGYSLGTEALRAGEELPFTLYWRALKPLDVDYTVFVHLLDEEGRRIGQGDSQPLNGSYPTSRWPIEALVADERWIQVPPDAPAGRYQLAVGMYDLKTMRRLGEGGPEPPVFLLGPIQVR
jgi:4-amino-4-deoxy-L-arabinose transferase-like glycosyltransferase